MYEGYPPDGKWKQVSASIPQVLWRPFKAMLVLRGQTYVQWLTDHMQAALREEERRQRVLHHVEGKD